LADAEINKFSPYGGGAVGMMYGGGFDFNILTAFIRLGRAGPVRGRVPSNPAWFGPGALLIII